VDGRPGRADWWRPGVKNPLAGDGFRALGSPISLLGDHGAAQTERGCQRLKNAG
jgi:hypothetical protein